jgi:hypothetical protein
MADTTNKSDSKDTTPPKWSGPEDARAKKGSGKYPYYYTTRTRSGHVFTLDDSEGHESVTLQHRGGSMVQFMPDGAVQFVAQNGQYTFVFGENRVKITGAYDVTVEGAASMRVKGDYNTTVMGNHNMTVNGDMNIAAKNFNAQVRGDMDINAKSFTAKMEGSTEISSHGITSIGGDGGLALISTGSSVGIGASKDVTLKAKGGKMMLETGSTLDIKASGLAALSTSGNFTIKSGGTIGLDGGPNIRMNEGIAEDAKTAEAVFPQPTNPNPTNPGAR